MSLPSFFIAATAAALLQYFRVREARQLPLAVMFALLAAAHAQPDWLGARPYHFGAGLAGLALLVTLSPHRAPGQP